MTDKQLLAGEGDNTMKTADLTGAALDWAVAKCKGLNQQPRHTEKQDGDCKKG